MSVGIVGLTGDQLNAALPDLAQLRINVFRNWPYLYDGSLDYERDYLAKFASAVDAICIAARDGENIVGAATALPLSQADNEFKAPFEKAGYDINSIFYCGESVLLVNYRGKGIGHAFFDGREAHAAHLGSFSHAAFCGVLRPADHPLRPEDYVPLDAFWRKRGYAPVEGVVASYDWKDIDQQAETSHPMQFWMKPLSSAV